MGLGGVYLKLTRNWQALEKITAHEWFLKVMGEEAYNRLFRPLLIGKFGAYYQQVNMAWMWARIYKRSLKLGTFEGGFQKFLDLLGEAVTAQGASIHLNSPVTRIHTENGKPALTLENGQTEVFDRVISTASPGLMLKITEGLAETAYGAQIKALESIGGLCVVLALKNPLMNDGTYWLNLPANTPEKSQNPFPFLALVEHTNYVSREHYGGDHIIYCGDYAPVDHEYFHMSDADLIARFLPSLRKVNPAFQEDWVRKAWVWRAPYAQPVPRVNHSEKIPALKTPIAGLYWASMSQVYPWDRGTNYAVEIGRRVAREALG
jgi:protoporphyrinogen oxidase